MKSSSISRNIICFKKPFFTRSSISSLYILKVKSSLAKNKHEQSCTAAKYCILLSISAWFKHVLFELSSISPMHTLRICFYCCCLCLVVVVVVVVCLHSALDSCRGFAICRYSALNSCRSYPICLHGDAGVLIHVYMM